MLQKQMLLFPSIVFLPVTFPKIIILSRIFLRLRIYVWYWQQNWLEAYLLRNALARTNFFTAIIPVHMSLEKWKILKKKKTSPGWELQWTDIVSFLFPNYRHPWHRNRTHNHKTNVNVGLFQNIVFENVNNYIY
jgi:hypothetical protein